MIAVDGAAPFPAELVGLDPITDVAVLRRHSDTSMRPRGRQPTLVAAPLGDSETLAVGETLLAIGYPIGLGQTATRGILTARDRTLPLGPLSWSVPMLQTDAAVSRGNSGGPLVDSCGEVVGMAAVLLTRATDAALAIPAGLLREIAGEIIEKGRVVRPWHGLSGQMVPPIFAMLRMPPGFMIETIEPGSPAEQAGLQGGSVPLRIGPEEYLMGGDILIAVDGRRIAFPGSLIEIVRGLKVGQRIRVTYLREDREMEVEATLPERPSLPGDFRRFDDW
jgi:putative serine protease PepD